MKTVIKLLAFLTLNFITLSFTTKLISQKKDKHLNILQTEIDGKTLFQKKMCNLCHSPEKENVGPSLKAISKIYNGNKEAISKFLDGKSIPIVQPEEFEYMKGILLILKKMKPEERAALAEYIASFNK